MDAYFPFWERHNCDEDCGTIESMAHVAHPLLPCHTAGWFRHGGGRGYTYGFGAAEDYDGPVPEGFELKRYPAGYYLVFYHPPFDFMAHCEEVMRRVENLAQSFDAASLGFAWDEGGRQEYQRQQPEELGYEVLRPVKPL